MRDDIHVALRAVDGAATGPEKRPAPCALLIFGASGDLTRRKLMPALFQLFCDRQLPECFRIVGFARSELNDEQFRQSLGESVSQFARTQPVDQNAWAEFARHLHYRRGDYGQASAYADLRETVMSLAHKCGDPDNRLIYLATPPSLQETILGGLRDGGLVYPDQRPEWSRVIIEKPFGRDLASAGRLNRFLADILREDQTYRIDHYLGKETVQNILVLRFANAIFEPLWNRNHIDHVQITAAEAIGVEGRGGFYDEAGVVRDFVQNHLLEVLALIAMEQPVSFQADPVRDEKVKVIRSLHPLLGDLREQVVLGQYDGYRNVSGVAPDSRTPTYAALRVRVDNWRWQGVPFYLRAGKALGGRVTEVNIHFKSIPFCLFGETDVCERLRPNVLTLSIQPDEGIKLKFGCKTPGDNLRVSDVIMDFGYEEAFGRKSPEAYERLLVDAMKGDQTLFARNDAVEHAWRFVAPLLAEDALPTIYAPGSAGPTAAAELLRRDGRDWDAI